MKIGTLLLCALVTGCASHPVTYHTGPDWRPTPLYQYVPNPAYMPKGGTYISVPRR